MDNFEKEIAGIITIYNPTNPINVMENILSISDRVKLIIIIDNSDNDSFKYLIPDLPEKNFVYMPMYTNTGVAKALNLGIREALHRNMKYALLMDQDSKFISKELEVFFSDFQKTVREYKQFLLCPSYPSENQDNPQFFTSGSVLKLNIINHIGGFNEKLFIDEVDGEFTRRLSVSKIPMLKSKSILTHQLGDKIFKNYFGMKLSSDNHNEVRKYYIARNRTYLVLRNMSLFRTYFKDSLLKLILMLLIEKNVWLKLKYVKRGVIDGITGNMGKMR